MTALELAFLIIVLWVGSLLVAVLACLTYMMLSEGITKLYRWRCGVLRRCSGRKWCDYHDSCYWRNSSWWRQNRREKGIK